MGGSNMKLNRRDFIRNTSLVASGMLLLPTSLWAGNRDEFEKLTILHTNDMHSHIEPFPVDDPKYPGQGGMRARAAMIRKIRSEEANVLLLDAGDIFQGTPYFNLYGGELEFKLMSQMNYDASTIGNHDFDNGIEGLNRMLPHAKFPFINANYKFDDTALNGKVIPHAILHKGTIKVGLFGVGVALAGLVDKKNYGDTQYLDPIKVANEKASYLKQEEKCDIVICLSHLGYNYTTKKVSDKILATETSHIDLIIGGHTHTFLDKPDETYNQLKEKTYIVQAGWAGVKLGRVDFLINKSTKKVEMTGGIFDVAKII